MLTPRGYRSRLIESKLELYLDAFGAVEIRGPKWCGKTWLALSRAESAVFLDNESERSAVETNRRLGLLGARPHLIDEWPEVPALWDAVRHEVDAGGSEPGQFILTGSSRPHGKQEVHHSGAGRIARLNMAPLTLFEQGLSDGSASMESLFEGNGAEAASTDTSLEALASMICTGGWPGGLGRDERVAAAIPHQYIEAVCDPSEELADAGIDPVILRRVLAALARNEGGGASLATIETDAAGGEGALSSDGQVFKRYLTYLEHSYLIRSLPGWDAPVRARARTRSRPKRYLADPSLSASLLGLNAGRLQWDTQAFGMLFESLCLRDISVYLEASVGLPSPSLRYYRDSYGLEVDAVIELADGRWAALEMKLSAEKADKAAQSLLRLRGKVMSNPLARNREPAFLAVIVGESPFMYQREDGVYVIPITCLGV